MGTGESDRASGAGQAPFVFCRLPSPSGVPACRVLNTAPVCIRGGTALSRAVCWFCSIRVASAVAAAGMAAMFVTQNTDFIASIELRIFFALGCAGIVESGERLYQWSTRFRRERLFEGPERRRFREGAVNYLITTAIVGNSPFPFYKRHQTSAGAKALGSLAKGGGGQRSCLAVSKSKVRARLQQV